MPDNIEIMMSMQADVDALRERYPRTADLYREACSIMFFRYGVKPTANALYQLVRKGSMSVPSDALRQFWHDLRERARVDLQHADLPDQVKKSAGELVGEIWSLARTAADESIKALRESAAAEREAALVERANFVNQTAQLERQLEDAGIRLAFSEAAISQQREELSARSAIERETQKRLGESRAELERLQSVIDAMSTAHVTEIDKITWRVLQAEQRYTELEKRTLVDLDRARMTAAKLQKQLDAERKTLESRLDDLQAQFQAAQVELARKGQELGSYMAKAELLADERDRATRHAEESVIRSAELDSQLAAERARVAELRGQLERKASKTTTAGREARPVPGTPRQRRAVQSKPDK